MKYKTLKDNNFILPHILLGLRGCLLALFVAVVLTACGGGGAAPVVDNCPIDPFGATCGDEYAAQRAEKINECLIEDMATEDTSCASAVNAQSCLADPFADGCDENQGFSVFLEAAKNERESFCNIDDNAKDTLCVGAVATFCGDNPFYRLCTAKSYTDQQEQIVADCITDGKAGESDCANAVKFNPCIHNPYTPECVTQTDARTMRETFCRKDDNATNALCAGAVVHFCELDPFDAICNATDYSRQQNERTALCISDANASNTALCANAISQNACISNPFGAGCDSETTARNARESYCRAGNEGNALCTDVVVHFCDTDTRNDADPFDGLCDATTYEMQRKTRMDECDGKEPTDPRCTNVLFLLAKMTCTDEPFGKGCEDDTERMMRENLCRASNNALGQANDSQCTGALAHFCGSDPFDGLCNPTTYSAERRMRVAECIMDDNASDDDLCANAISQNACISNPYGTNCGSETAARTARESFCRVGNSSNSLCTGAVTHFCRTSPTANPFDADLCMTYGSTRDSIIRGCITADDTRLEHDDCTNARVANPCIETPFDRNCVTDFAPYYQDARTKRTTFCAGRTNNTHALCAGAVATNPCFNNPFVRDLDNNGAEDCSSEFAARREEQINTCIARDVGQTVGCINVLAGIGGCLANPFHSSCHADVDAHSNPNTYFKDYADAARAARVDFCDMDDGAIRDHDYCFGRTFNHDICVYDPYSSFCDDKFFNADLNTTVKEQRTEKVVFCSGNDNEDHGSCTHVRDLVTAATWAHGFDNPLNTSPTARTNEFLRAENVFQLDKSSVLNAFARQLNLATSTFDYNQFGGDATDGVEFFFVPTLSSPNYYAGILGGSDLGKPLSGATRTLNWNGQIVSIMNLLGISGTIVTTDFTLTIDFNGSGGTLTSFAKAFLDDLDDIYYYDIEGDFNEDGLITRGTVVYAEFTGGDKNSRVDSSFTDDDATLSGIIGEEGVLGVFQGADFTGGFAVHPTIKARVEISDWVRGFGDTAPATAPTAGNGFLQEVSGELTFAPTKITAGGADTTAFEFVTLNTVTEGEQDFVNDVSWFSGYHTDNIQYHYATVSDTAYLGEPLSEAPTSGIWYGKFGAGANKTDFALTITYSTSERKISAFVRESVGVYYLLAGDFNSAGVITNGTVNYGAFTNGVRTAPVASRAANGTLTGLIGQGGVLGAFHSTATGTAGYAGGFWAAPVDKADDEVSPFNADVDYGDWSRSFLSLADNPDTDTPQNQFLATTSSEYPSTGTISTTGTTATQAGGKNSIVYSVDLNAINLDGADLGLLNTTSRVDWFSGYIGGTQYHYAGVVRANLGAPLTTTPTGGEWRGVIYVGESRTDFTLTITYETAGGTLSAFVRDTPNVYYLLDGGFDANGLIDGTVRYGAFTNNDRNNINEVAPSGVLTGLIGTDGALGVFHSTATGAAGYSGGFVALPGAPTYDSDVKYSDYRRSFLSLGLPDTTTPKNQFVTDATGVMTEENGGTPATENTLALNTNTLDGLALGGTADNSLFWFDGFAGSSSTRTYYAGLGGAVNLGAPIDTSANWRGVFAVGNAKTDFTLNINFANGGGTIAARIRASVDFNSPESGAFYYQLDGDFDASGLITGDVYYGRSLTSERPAKTGILTGLIGAEGAVGAFYSIATGDLGYSGGFVANDEATAFDDTTVRYETWARSFLLDDKADTNDRRNQFLRSSKADGTLNIGVGDSSRIINLDTAKFNDESIGGDATTRYQSFDFQIATVYSNYLGILPGTDLGMPVVNGSTELTWYGNFTENYSDVIGTRSADFVLKLTFNSGMNDGELAARINYQNSAYYILKGTFDAGGLITGTVAFDVGDFNDEVNGVLTGIIGQEGAIGVFHGTDLEDVTSLNYGGGFVARPKSGTFTDSVKYSDWLARENPDTNPSAENEFLKTTAAKDVNTGAVIVTSEFTLNLNTAEFDGAPILGDADAGFAGLFGTISGTPYAYAGIYQMTDLGAPLTQTSGTIMWNGVIRLGGTESSTEFTISFTGTGGTIDAFELNFLNADDLFISGTFDDLGLITGDVHFADFTTQTNPSPPPNPDGTLSGLIGAEGAVGVFHSIVSNNRYSGGFVASPYVKLQANWNDWEDRNNFDNEISDDPRQNQFLSGYHGALSGLQIASSSGAETATGFTIGLNDGTFTDEATYGGVRLGGNGTGGIIYWHGFQENDAERLYYAQIHTDTKLGAIIEENVGTADYHGQFRAFKAGTGGGGGTSTNTDFTLEVDFARDSIAAFVRQDDNNPADTRYYLLSGSYDENGVISGDVTYDIFLNGGTNDRTPANAGRRVGKLTGLISKDNALGVFVSGDTLGTTSGTRGYVTGTESRGLDGFAGGFVARRAPFTNVVEQDDNDNLVTYNDWNRIINPVDLASLTRSQFLQTNDRTISHGRKVIPDDIKTVDFTTAEYGGTPALRGGDARDGFAYFSVSRIPTYVGYSGIFSTTDLGAPLVETTSPTLAWNGQLNFLEFTHDFTLNIAFNSDGGTINGFVEGAFNSTRDLLLEGDFDANGVITGTTNYATYTGDVPEGTVIGTPRPGILSGLIGQEGAVGVFNSTSSSLAYAGGFVVHEDISIKVDYYDWLRGATYATARTDGNKFLQPTEQSFASITGSTVFSLDLNDNFEGVSLGGDANNGFANFTDSSYTYAGIYQTTNLGVPRTERSGTARWLGLIQFNEKKLESNFDLTFNSSGGTIKALHANLFDHFDLLIDGDFDTNGRISGKVHYSRIFHDAATAAPRNLQRGTLSGIIGQEGAVGAFFGDSVDGGFNYSGGFVASPTAVGDGNVTYTDWVRGTATDALPDGFVVRSQFLRTTNAAFTSLGGVTLQTLRKLDLNDVTEDGLRLGGSGSNGLLYITTSGTNSYAGIYSSTNLGAPLPSSPAQLLWKGIVRVAIGGTHYRDDFTLTITVNADGSGGRIFSDAAITGSGTLPIRGSFDAQGVISGTAATSTPLSGLIGQEGAVGVFWHSSSALVGGFVAHKTAEHDEFVNYTDWRRETETARAPDTSPARSQFLEMSGDNFISTAGVTIRRQNQRRYSHRLNSGNTGGVLYFLGTNNKGYAGIYSTTDLGAPLPSITGTATWRSFFGVTNFSNGENHTGQFNLLVTSNGRGGRIRAEEFNIGNALWRISGQFDENGVVSGNINQNHTISGLIGRAGVVVAFISTSSTGVNNAGGWVGSGSFAPAQPRSFFALPANADYTAWRDSFTPAPANLDTANRRNQLLASTSNNGISDEGNTGRKPILIENLNLSTAEFNNKALGGNVGDGVALFKDYPRDDLANSPFYNYATILSTTDLGLPLPYKANYNGDATAMWKGAATFGDGNFTLEVNFAQSKVEAFHPDSFSKYYHLKGDYDVHGVISGTTAYGRFNTSTRAAIGTTVPGILTGLIGQDGAVGVIIGGTSSDGGVTITGGTGADGYVGGFVACPLHADGRCMSADR